MGSWREEASQQAQDDLDGLLDTALPFATEMLESRGEFFPYAVALSSNGVAQLLSGDPDDGERPESTAVLDVLVSGLRSDDSDHRAVALVSDVRTSTSDAVRVELEHAEGHCLAVLLPYKKRRLRRGVEFGDLIATPSTMQVWT